MHELELRNKFARVVVMVLATASTSSLRIIPMAPGVMDDGAVTSAVDLSLSRDESSLFSSSFLPSDGSLVFCSSSSLLGGDVVWNHSRSCWVNRLSKANFRNRAAILSWA